MISYPFKDYPLKGRDGKVGHYAGIVKIERTGPDYRGERWVITDIQAQRHGNGLALSDDCLLDLERWIRKDRARNREVEEMLAQADKAEGL